jgi:predicted glutamine amidotransferase
MMKYRSIIVASLVVSLFICDVARSCTMLAASFNQVVDFTDLFSTFTRLNGGPMRDGWGVAFYPDASAAIYKEPIRVTDSALANWLIAQKAVQSKIFTLHLRQASGHLPPCHRNTHPWVREWDGREYVVSLMGAADKRIFETFKPAHFKPISENPPEIILCEVLSRMKDENVTEWNQDRFAWLHGILVNINRYQANVTLLISDGTRLFAYGGMSYCRREMPPAKPGSKSGEPGRVEPATGYIIARSTKDLAMPGEQWVGIQKGQLVVFNEGQLIYNSSTAAGKR